MYKGIRCKIIDVEGQSYRGCVLHTPEISYPHINKLGYAKEVYLDVEGFEDIPTVKITLDDGNILMGYECWWEPV